MSEQELHEQMLRRQQLTSLLESFAQEYRPLLLSLIERQAALRLRGWATEIADTIQRRILLACADQKAEIARRIEALFPNARAIEIEITDSVPEVRQFSQLLFLPVRMQARLATQVQIDRICAQALRDLAAREGFEQARQTLSSCAVLESKAADGIEGMLAVAA